MVECPACHAANRAAATFCGSCGYRLSATFVKNDRYTNMEGGRVNWLYKLTSYGRSLLTRPSQTISTGTSSAETGYAATFSNQSGPSRWGKADSWTSLPPVIAGIKCPKCSSINRDTAKFCGMCGITLTSFRSLSKGTIVGSYVIEERIGVGGIGTVYRARHRIMGNLVVAIKIHDYFPEDEQVGIAFRQSANYLSQLRHRNIVQLIDYGFQSGHGYLAMEYIDGPNFDSLIPQQQSKVWLNECLEYFRQLLSALYYAHNCPYRDLDSQYKKGIIHGDIKPQNIFLDRSTNTAKLTDFMIPDVQKLLSEGKKKFNKAQTDAFGTVGYMPPEQMMGGVLTQQSDIFSLGVTMYVLVTGNRPLDAWENINPKSVNPYIPDWLDEIIMKSVERTPLNRYRTVGEMFRVFNEHRNSTRLSMGERKWEVILGDKIEGNKPMYSYSIGDISNSTVSGVVQGDNNRVISNLNDSGKTELAQALKTLTDAIMDSKDLPADQKEDQVKIVNQIGEEAAKPKPNKTLLKILGDGLMATLKAIPDVAATVASVAPLLALLL